MSDTKLNTEDAARFLGVSEASIRRWSDSGLLPVERTGRRGTRRFAQQELARFREAHARHVPARRTDGVFIGALHLSLHTHLATFYETDAARLRLSLPLLRDGLRAGQPCFLVALGEVRDLYLQALDREAGVSVKDAVEQGVLSILPGVGPRTEDALAMWEAAFWKAVNRGAKVLRVVGEMESVAQVLESESEMIGYEFAINAITDRFPCVVLCQYDVRRFNGTAILGALKAHPQLLGPRLADCLL
jgi:DcmR-like sensory protein/helix-turn-helix protein